MKMRPGGQNPELPKEIWIMHDLSNSNEGSKNYLWWFETKKQANEFSKHHKKLNGHSKLTKPIRFKREE